MLRNVIQIAGLAHTHTHSFCFDQHVWTWEFYSVLPINEHNNNRKPQFMCKARPWNQRNSPLIYKRRENHISLCHSISLEVLGVFFSCATFRFGAAVFITLCFRCPFTQMLNDKFCWSTSIVVGAYRMCRPYKMYLCVLLINETRWLDANDSTTISAYSSFVVFITKASFSSNNWPIIVLPFSVLLYFNPTDFFLLLGEAETDSYTCNGMVH